MLEFHKCDAKIEKETFDAITEVFRVNKLKGWYGTIMISHTFFFLGR